MPPSSSAPRAAPSSPPSPSASRATPSAPGIVEDLGCWNDGNDFEGQGKPRTLVRIDKTNQTPQECAIKALAAGNTFMAMQNGEECYGGKATADYKKYGKSTAVNCPAKGDGWINHVYKIGQVPL